MIKGGYILQPRIIDESDLIHESPVVRETWLYLLRNVAHKDTDKFKRGSGFFQLDDIANGLHWFVGYRKMKYSKPQLTKSLRRLCESNMIETTKATRGLFVTICKYDYYQNPKNYEGNDEGNTKETRRNFGGHTIHKNDKELKKEEKEDIYIEFDFLKSLIELGVDKKIASDWMKVRKTKKATNTQTAFDKIKTHIEKSKLTPNECIRISVENSWSGFNAEWIKTDTSAKTTNKYPAIK